MKQENSFKNNEIMMQMSPWDFDQSPNGWRKFENTKEYLKAISLIQEYITKNKDRILNPREGDKKISLGIMYFHIGQLFALEGQKYYPEAIKEFDRSFEENQECWNAYVSATIGFLENNVKKVKDAIKLIKASQEADKRGGNMGIVRNFKKALELGELDYENPLLLWPRENFKEE